MGGTWRITPRICDTLEWLSGIDREKEAEIGMHAMESVGHTFAWERLGLLGLIFRILSKSSFLGRCLTVEQL